MVLLREIVDEPSLRLTVRWGHDRLRRDITWVTITELPDPGPFLRGGEVVLTTGISQVSADQQRRFVHHVAGARAAALGFGTGLSHHNVPDAFLAAATEHEIPVFEVPYATPFIAVTQFIADRIAEGHYGRLRQLLDDHDTLARTLLTGQGLRALVRMLRRMVDAPVCVVDYHGTVLASAPDRAAWPIEQILRTGADRTDEELPAILVRPVEIDGRLVAFLCVRRTAARLDVAPYAVSLVGLELARRQAVLRGRRELVGQVVEDIVRGAISAHEGARRLAPYGFSPGDRHAVVLGSFESDPRLLRTVPWSLYSLRETPREPLITGLVDSYFAALVGEEQPLRDVAHMMVEYLSHIGTGAGVGIGGRYEGIEGLRWSYFEARDALTRGTGVHEGEPLSLPQLLLANPDLPLRDLGWETLRPILCFDEENGGQLVVTLRTFLELDASVQATARRLYIHRNTVRYRLAQVEELTNRSLASTQDRVTFWLALQAIKGNGQV
ncbi:MAG: PucR family transcriptional regulator [Streptosporangiaceae bacterium]